MANVREWLDKNYPKNQRKDIREIDITDNNLEGSLKLKWFDNLEKFYCSGNNLTDLDVSNCTKLEKLNCSNNKLSSLNLSNLSSLKELDFSFNNLTNDSLFLPNLENLETLRCNDNHLTNLDFFSNFDKKTN